MKGVARKRLNRPQTVGPGESSAPKPSAPPNFVGDPWILFRADETNSEESRLLGRARTLAALGRVDDAVALCNEVIKRKELKGLKDEDWNDDYKVFVHARFERCLILAEAGRMEESSAAFEDGFLKDQIILSYLSDWSGIAFYVVSDEFQSDRLELKLRPASEAAVTPPLRMGDDLNTKVKKAKAENLARAKPRPKPRSSTLQLATYKALVAHVDLLNRELPETERLRRARRLVRAYGRVRERRPKFHDDNEQLRAAYSIVNKDQHQRGKLKAAGKIAFG